MKKIISLIVICLLLTACSEKYKTITTNEALDLIENGAIVIDVRSDEEYKSGHIKGAINIPVDEIENITYDKDDTIILYCATGVRSANAVNILADMGYTSLYNLDGGLLNWGSDLEE